MNWTDQMDGYCERTDLTFWSEPLNAVTNLSFILFALIMWRRSGGLMPARILCVILFAIGVGSFLFHTFATAWAALADVAPIGLFILFYLFLVHRDFLGWPLWGALLGTMAFFPFAAVMVPFFDSLPFFHISNFYWTVPLLLVLYAPFVGRVRHETAQGMLLGALILTLSISLRSFDELICDEFPTGTHIFWHLLNGVMLGWMIEVYRRHMAWAGGERLAGESGQG